MRNHFYNILEKSDSSTLARAVSSLLMVLIMCNVVAVILASYSDIYADMQVAFDRFELFSIVVFSVEYLIKGDGGI